VSDLACDFLSNNRAQGHWAEIEEQTMTIAERTGTAKRDRGLLRVDVNECKGCGLCIEACPPKAIHMSEGLNHYGYRTAKYNCTGCSGCGICFMACPEPGAITVLRLRRGVAVQQEEALACASN
jgi:2-oxoglutarate ferredoxin oxidoreductase subunit delta